MRRLLTTLSLLALLALGLGYIAQPPGIRAVIDARLSDIVPASLSPQAPTRPATPWASALILAARAQIGVTTSYDGAYTRLAYPGGDVPRKTGVCTDVLIRALRDSHGIDLQQRLHEDMGAAFSSYPTRWGLSHPDANIDHRRVPNLRRYFERARYDLPVSTRPEDYQPGDIVTWNFTSGAPHIGIVSDQIDRQSGEPLILHNVGAGTREQRFLFAYPITGHYRLDPAQSRS